MPEIGPFSFSKEVMNEGDFAQISCIVTSGDQPLTISWSFHGSDGDDSKSFKKPDTGITTTNLGSRMSMLVIEQVQHHHQGLYTCLAKNTAGTKSYTTELKVNGIKNAFIVVNKVTGVHWNILNQKFYFYKL